ncbi:MAG: hypothetical protein ACYCW6_12210 [Candidatus Xenobia bacterium]
MDLKAINHALHKTLPMVILLEVAVICGGLLESLSFWTGLRALLLIAAVLYLASVWFLPRPAEAP